MTQYEIVRNWDPDVIRRLVLRLRADGLRQIVGRAPDPGEFRLYRSRGAKTRDSRDRESKARGMFCCMWKLAAGDSEPCAGVWESLTP